MRRERRRARSTLIGTVAAIALVVTACAEVPPPGPARSAARVTPLDADGLFATCEDPSSDYFEVENVRKESVLAVSATTTRDGRIPVLPPLYSIEVAPASSDANVALATAAARRVSTGTGWIALFPGDVLRLQRGFARIGVDEDRTVSLFAAQKALGYAIDQAGNLPRARGAAVTCGASAYQFVQSARTAAAIEEAVAAAIENSADTVEGAAECREFRNQLLRPTSGLPALDPAQPVISSRLRSISVPVADPPLEAALARAGSGFVRLVTSVR